MKVKMCQTHKSNDVLVKQLDKVKQEIPIVNRKYFMSKISSPPNL